LRNSHTAHIFFALLAFSPAILASLSSAKNAQIRACLSVGGEFSTIETQLDNVGLCKVGLSYVGALDILHRNSVIEAPLSLHYYKKGVRTCPIQNLITSRNSQGHNIKLCFYSDESLIDLDTLSAGHISERNVKLDVLLKLKTLH
jgi:hypothetical protein